MCNFINLVFIDLQRAVTDDDLKKMLNFNTKECDLKSTCSVTIQFETGGVLKWKLTVPLN